MTTVGLDLHKRYIAGCAVDYDLTDQEVQILTIVCKVEAQAWLDAHGTADP